MKTSLTHFVPLVVDAHATLRRALPALWCGVMVVASLPAVRAAGPPEAMAYQGFLVDANGNPLAPSTPANYPVVFRIFATPTGGASLWSEQQIVTVDKGNFSVILSEGTSVASEPKPLLSTVLSTNGVDRYIELSVTIGAAPPAPMLPRMRLLPLAYSFLAASANNLVSPSGVPVIKYANNRVEVTGDISLSGGIAGNGSGLSGLSANQIGSGTFSDARLSANVALRAGGNSFTGSQTINGNVGIGASPVDAALDVEGDIRVNTRELFLREGSDRNHGLGWYGASKLFSGVNVDGPVLYGWSGGGLASRSSGDKFALIWDAAGRIGIGNTAPGKLLHLGSASTANSEGMLRLASRSGSGGANRTWDVGVPETDEVTTGVGYSFVIDDTQAAGTEFIVKYGSGNVGIGTTDPAAKLEVNGAVRVTAANTLELGAGVAGKEGSAGKIGYQTFSSALDIVGAGSSVAARKVKIWSEGGASIAGRLGINTDNPAVPLDVSGNARITMTDNGYKSGEGSWSGNTYTLVDAAPTPGGEGPEVFGMRGGIGSSGPNPAGGVNSSYIGSVAIRANGGYIASSMGIVVYSDQRIKRDAKPSDTAKDLASIEKLRVTNYRMVDPADGGTGWRKGFIAQEVEEVVPGAVTRTVEFVPDIFSVSTNTVYQASAKTLAVSLPKEHGLKAGDHVRLHVDGTRLDASVTAVLSAHEFVVGNCQSAPEKVFVFGRQVSDFRTVDYDRIFTTGIGAIQELAGKVQALESAHQRIAQLEAGVATAALRHRQELGELQREIGMLKDRLAWPARADALQSELDQLKKTVQQLTATQAQMKTAPVAAQPSVVPTPGSDVSVSESLAVR